MRSTSAGSSLYEDDFWVHCVWKLFWGKYFQVINCIKTSHYLCRRRDFSMQTFICSACTIVFIPCCWPSDGWTDVPFTSAVQWSSAAEHKWPTGFCLIICWPDSATSNINKPGKWQQQKSSYIIIILKIYYTPISYRIRACFCIVFLNN